MELVSIFFSSILYNTNWTNWKQPRAFCKKNISSVIESAIFSEIFQDDDLDAKVCFCDP